MRRLTSGFHSFRAKEFPRRREQFEALAAGQFPHTLFITCSDSRIDPSLITQTDPGELFIIRNAGNLVPPPGKQPAGGEAATVEYAVVALGVEHIVVCGHSHCGAMAGLLAPESLKGLPGVSAWLRHATPTLERVRGASRPDDRDPVRANVAVQLENLRAYPFVREREQAGELTLHGWVYRFERGEVLELGADGRFSPLIADATGIPA